MLLCWCWLLCQPSVGKSLDSIRELHALTSWQVNLAQNSISCGMDLAALWPKYIDVARGGVIMCIVGYAINPWRFVNQPTTFITVLNSFGMFVAPLAGVNAIDFWLVRKRNWNVPHLYVGDSRSIYWYTGGWNWRGLAAWVLAVWPSFPGFVSGVAGSKVALGWTRAFQVSWIIGFAGGAFIYYIICLISHPPGNPYESVHLHADDAVIDGLEVSGERNTNGSTASVVAIEDELKH
jgi:NCS1 family nucleobase:cation symporter-1